MNLPDPQPKVMPYLTIVPTRRPEQKIHANLGHAKNAINGKMDPWRGGAECDMQLLEHVDGGWKLVYDVKKGDLNPPWQVEAVRKREEKAAAQRLRAEILAQRAAKKLAEEVFEEEYGGMNAQYEDRMMFVSAYVAGYLRGQNEAGH